MALATTRPRHTIQQITAPMDTPKTPPKSQACASPRSVTSEAISSPRGSRPQQQPKALFYSKISKWMLFLCFLGVSHVLFECEVHDGQLLLMDSTGTTVETKAYIPSFTFPPPEPKSAAVFYHVFFPDTLAGQQNSARIIREQLQQFQASQQKLTIYYNTIGQATPHLNTTHIQEFCKEHSQTCHHMEHFQEGMEDKTLQRLHDFCSASTTAAEEDSVVLYLHNKGSFSTKPLNEAWRYQMTQSIASDACQSAVADQTCNLCGLWFSAERGMFMAGNMWRSSCSYIKKLIPPRDFQQAMHRVTAEAMLERLRWKILFTMQEMRSGVFGIDRYATEFWVASHPSVKPCDFSKAVEPMPETKNDITDHFLSWLRRMGADYKRPLQPQWFEPQAPHHPLPLSLTWPGLKFPDVRAREYFLLAGNLFRWNFLYHEAPPRESWVYRWFPDGDKWRDAVKKYGNESVSFVTSEALKAEVASGRNKYTADHSTKLTVIPKKKAALKGVTKG